MSNANVLVMGPDLMSAEQEASGSWVAILTGASAILSFVAGLAARGWSLARARGENDGEMRVRLMGLESRLADIAAQGPAVEARVNLRLASLEARKDRTDDLLRNVPDREEMNERFDRIDRKIEQLASSVHRDTWNGASRPIT